MAKELISFHLVEDIKVLSYDGLLHHMSKISFTSVNDFVIVEGPDVYYVALRTYKLAFPILENESELYDILSEAGLSDEEIRNKLNGK